MLVADFDYELPGDLIAQEPLEDRAAARMLVVHRATRRLEDRCFRDFPDFLESGDCVVVNNTRVFPARLYGRRPGGPARIEVLLTRQFPDDPAVWEALVRPGRKVRTGTTLHFPEGLQAEVLGRGLYGERTIRFSGAGDVARAIERIGHTPLPPYIRRPDLPADREHYQTVYARLPGSVAAPTAGLHFTPDILARLPNLVEVTLHVGLGTFQAVHAANVEEHRMHREWFEVSEGAAAAIRAAARVVAVGTTSVRTLEHVARTGPMRAASGETDIFIYPGFDFRVTGALLTNFHLPRSTLLMLVCAFAGRELVLEAYRHAVRERYRFYSYGDCMLIL
jgi:S-adenosylmethionine:tRNA ribosyltransferase-isomerase